MANIEQVQYIISELALRHNLVNSAFSGPSIYQINPEVVKEYPFIFISPTGTHVIKENVTRYSFSIFFVDRLLDDNSNENAVFSVAVETLKNLYKQIKELEFVTDVQEEVNVRLFGESEKMNDRCAGGYMELWLEVLNAAACGEWFDEYGNPMGEYFNIEQIDNVLDSLASKTWVIQKIREIGGVTIDDVDREIDRKLRPYATERYVDDSISALLSGYTPEFSGITHDISELSATTQDLQEQIDALSGGTSPELSGITQEIEAVSAQTLENAAQITAITAQIEILSGATPSDYDSVKGQVSANTQDIASLSAVTSGLSSQISGKQDALSGSTHISVQDSVVSSIDLVASSTVTTIWTGTQVDYTLIPVKDPHTVYIVI